MSSTAKRSSLDNWRALLFKRRLRLCRFFSSAAWRLRTSRRRPCSTLMSAIFVASDSIIPPSSSADARSVEPMAAMRRSVVLLELEAAADPAALLAACPSLAMAREPLTADCLMAEMRLPGARKGRRGCRNTWVVNA